MNSRDTKPNHDRQLELFRDDLYDKFGIYFPEEKFYQLKAKIQKRLTELDLNSVGEYQDYLEDNPKEITPLLDEISTNHTRFYREPRHWQFLKETLIPRWEDRPQVKAWSAACSSGEEPYTLALLLEHFLGQDSSIPVGSSPYRILASDLSEEIIHKGVKGVYSREAVSPLKKHHSAIVRQHRHQVEPNRLEIDQAVQENVVFRQFNLKKDVYPFSETFDLILIRNVLIYFDLEMKRHVIQHLKQALNTGGYLWIGHSESLSNFEHGLKRVRPAIYKK